MRIKNLLRGFKISGSMPENLDITDVVENSSDVKRGSLFVAVKGIRNHGISFADQAVKKGAAAILTDHTPEQDFKIPLLVHSHPERILIKLALRAEGNPERDLTLIGVTGTNGKTTTSSIIAHMLPEKSAFIGTTHIQIGDERQSADYTTPPATVIARLLFLALEKGCENVVMEVSSHALMLNRVTGLPLDAAVFLNLQHDHLDFHKTMSAYFSAKKRIFKLLRKNGIGVVNRADSFGSKLSHELNIAVATFGTASGCSIRLLESRMSGKGTHLKIDTPSGIISGLSPLLGNHNVENVMAALCTLSALGHEPGPALRKLGSFPGVPGRLERVLNDANLDILIDYAHTPESIAKVLETVKSALKKKIITVLGAGGDRDQGKRADMGESAGSHSDIVIVTSDNPRGESAARIAGDLLKGIRISGEKKVLTILDRKKAIETALKLSNSGFVVMLLGKGHENYQIIGNRKHPFSDRDVAVYAARQVSHAV